MIIVFIFPSKERSIQFWYFYEVILHLLAGCKESQFYSLPFGQAVASMY